MIGSFTAWYVGLALGFTVVAIAALIVAVILSLAAGIAVQADAARQGVEAVRDNTSTLSGLARVNDSAIRILHVVRAVRKAAVGK